VNDFLKRFGRKSAVVLSAGVMFQMGGCTLTGDELLTGLLVSVFNAVLNTFVGGLFIV
jgi:hypothetical protein